MQRRALLSASPALPAMLALIPPIPTTEPSAWRLITASEALVLVQLVLLAFNVRLLTARTIKGASPALILREVKQDALAALKVMSAPTRMTMWKPPVLRAMWHWKEQCNAPRAPPEVTALMWMTGAPREDATLALSLQVQPPNARSVLRVSLAPTLLVTSCHLALKVIIPLLAVHFALNVLLGMPAMVP